MKKAKLKVVSPFRRSLRRLSKSALALFLISSLSGCLTLNGKRGLGAFVGGLGHGARGAYEALAPGRGYASFSAPVDPRRWQFADKTQLKSKSSEFNQLKERLGSRYDRKSLVSDNDYELKRLLCASTMAEVGGMGQLAMVGYMENVMNRAMARGWSLKNVITERGYYPWVTRSKLGRNPSNSQAQSCQAALNAVLAGSNITNCATDNASVGLANRRVNAGNPGVRIGSSSKVYNKELFYANLRGSGSGGDKRHTRFYQQCWQALGKQPPSKITVYN